MQCRSHVSLLGKLYPEIQAEGAEVLVILGDSSERAVKYGQLLKAPFPILADPERRVYSRYGLEKALLIVQRTASVIVGTDGRIAYIQRKTNPQAWIRETHKLVEILRDLSIIDGPKQNPIGDTE